MKSDPTPESRLRVGARVAVAAAVVAALVVGGALKLAGAAAVGVAAAGLLAVGTRTLTREDNRDRARGSLTVVAGVVAFPVAVGLGTQGPFADALLVGLLALAVAAVALDALIEDPSEANARVGNTLLRTGTALGIGLVLSLLVYAGVPVVGAAALVEGWALLVGYSDFLSLVALQVLAVGALVLVRMALPILEDWTPEGEGDVLDPLRLLGVDPLDLPWQVIVLLAGQALVVAANPRAGWFDAVLDSIAGLGDAIGVLLGYGVPHLPLLVVWLLAGAVLLGRGLQRAFVWWAGRNPPESVAYSTGGIAASVLAVVLSAIPPVSWWFADLTGLESVTQFGVGATALGVTLAGLVGYQALLAGIAVFSAAEFVPSPPGYAVGALALFLSSLGAAAVEVTPVAAFVGVAAAVLVWDLGRNTTVLRKQLGRNVDTREAERTHATASVLVGVGAVGLGTVATHVVGPGALAPANQDHATIALVLSMVALVSFVVLVER